MEKKSIIFSVIGVVAVVGSVWAYVKNRKEVNDAIKKLKEKYPLGSKAATEGAAE